MKGFQHLNFGVDGFSTLHMQHARDDAMRKAFAQLCRTPADAELAGRRAFHPEKVRCHSKCCRKRLVQRNAGIQRLIVGRAIHRQILAVPRGPVRYAGNEHGKETASEPARLHPGQIKMALVRPIQPQGIPAVR